MVNLKWAIKENEDLLAHLEMLVHRDPQVPKASLGPWDFQGYRVHKGSRAFLGSREKKAQWEQMDRGVLTASQGHVDLRDPVDQEGHRDLLVQRENGDQMANLVIQWLVSPELKVNLDCLAPLAHPESKAQPELLELVDVQVNVVTLVQTSSVLRVKKAIVEI